MVDFKTKLKDVPENPGVYLMLDSLGNIIYVGKAKKLKNRVTQYFQDNISHTPKTRLMVSKVDHFEVIVANTTFSEFQSYVNDCMSKGYNEDYYWWDDDSFSADKDDYDLSVKYIGNNVMKINLYYWG